MSQGVLLRDRLGCSRGSDMFDVHLSRNYPKNETARCGTLREQLKRTIDGCGNRPRQLPDDTSIDSIHRIDLIRIGNAGQAVEPFSVPERECLPEPFALLLPTFFLVYKLDMIGELQRTYHMSRVWTRRCRRISRVHSR